MKIIQHRRGRAAEWNSADPIIPDGELALVKRSFGYDIKVGDGVRKYSELGSISGDIYTDYDNYMIELVMRRGTDYRLGCVEELYLSFEGGSPGEDFYATVTFDCDEFGIAIILPDSLDVTFTGTDTYLGEFSPRNYTHYNLFFFWDGSLQCAVRGCSYE